MFSVAGWNRNKSASLKREIFPFLPNETKQRGRKL